MDEAKKLEQAQYVYGRICEALDARDWKYGKDEQKLVVHFGVNGENMHINFIIVADAERQMIRLLSPLDFKISQDKRVEGAIAACAASFGMADGSFDYDLSDGRITFRATQSFRSSVIGEGLIQYMIELTCAMVDKYNTRFLALDKGAISINDFIQKDA